MSPGRLQQPAHPLVVTDREWRPAFGLRCPDSRATQTPRRWLPMVGGGIRRQADSSEPGAEPHVDDARESSHDVVVIGGGIGGLTAGALLARAGKKVLVVEAEAQPGGFTTSTFLPERASN